MKKVLALIATLLLPALLAACNTTATTDTTSQGSSSSIDLSSMMSDTGSMMNATDTGATIDNSSYSQSPYDNGGDGHD